MTQAGILSASNLVVACSGPFGFVGSESGFIGDAFGCGGDLVP